MQVIHVSSNQRAHRVGDTSHHERYSATRLQHLFGGFQVILDESLHVIDNIFLDNPYEITSSGLSTMINSDVYESSGIWVETEVEFPTCFTMCILTNTFHVFTITLRKNIVNST